MNVSGPEQPTRVTLPSNDMNRATETGSKAVDAGSQQFADVAASFKSIVRLVTTTTEAIQFTEAGTMNFTGFVPAGDYGGGADFYAATASRGIIQDQSSTITL